MAVITLSRESGSQGNKICEILCKTLGYSYFDKKMMSNLAKELGWNPADLMDTNEEEYQALTTLEKILASINTPFGLSTEYFDRAELIERESLNIAQVKNLILSAYSHGNVIIVGRGGQIVLAGKPDVLHVRVVAPLERRIEIWQTRQVLSYEEARRLIRQRDRAHKDFVENFYDADLNDPSLYDLVVNTGKFSPEEAADVIIAMLNKLPKAQ